MESKIVIQEVKKEADYFPSLFTNKDKTVIILATERTGEKTFSGVVVHSDSKATKTLIGVYSTSWTYEQFKRLSKGSSVEITLTQTD